MRIATIQVDGQLQLGFGYQDQLIVPNKGFAESRGMPLSLQEAIELGPKLQDVFATLVEIYERDRNRSQFLSVLDPAAAEHGPAVPWNRKIICVGLNYSDHAAESKLAMADRPIIFSKYDNTLCGHGSVVRRPTGTLQMDYEAELAVVIGKTVKNASRDSALDAVFGYTVANDLSARDLQLATSQWLPGKSCDGFCPIGPVLVTSDEIKDPQDLRIYCSVNGDLRQNDTTAHMIFPVTELIEYISSLMTLQRGDVILTGTPQGVAMGMPDGEQKWLVPGDRVTAGIDGIGELTVTIA